jgi:large subunit ribosomal protein L14e
MIFDIGRICVKLAGRDAGKVCVVVDVIDDVYVLVEGATRRRKINVAHLEPLPRLVNISKNATRDEVAAALNTEGFSVEDKKSSRSPASKQATKRVLNLSTKKTKK